MLNFFKKQKVSILASVFAILSAFSIAIIVHAQSAQDLFGYGWSSNIGWVSFNCDQSSIGGPNTCGTASYKVTKSASGDLSGYAWSSNVGWISFDATGWPSGAGTTSSSAKIVGNQLVGWAKFLNGSSATGWDGWVSFTGSNYGVIINPPVGGVSTMSGYAWGSSVVGWLRMNQVTIGSTSSSSTMQLYASVNGSGNYAANTTIGPYTSGAIITLSWNVNNMLGGNGCMASGTWVGPKTTGSGTGTFVNAPIQYVNLGSTQVTKTFTLTCVKPDGISTLTQTINMLLDPLTAGTPTVQLFANSQPGGVNEPTVTVPSGPSNVSLSWTVLNVSPGWGPYPPATNAPHCLAGDDWATTPVALNIRSSNDAVQPTPHIWNGMTVINNTSSPITKTYSIKCTRTSDGAVVSSTVTVQVLPAAGISSVTINAVPLNIQPGQPSTLTYSSTSVVAGSCAPTAGSTAVGATQLSVIDWTGATLTANSTQSVLVHPPGNSAGESTTYTITCLGTDGVTRQAAASVFIAEGTSPLTIIANPGWVTTLNAPTALRWFNNTQTTLHSCVAKTEDEVGNVLGGPWTGPVSAPNTSNNFALWTPTPGTTGPMSPPPTPTIPVPKNATIFKVDCLNQMNAPVHAQVKVPVMLGNLSVKLFTSVNTATVQQGDQIPLLWNSPGKSEFVSCQGTSIPSVYEWVGNPTAIATTKVPNITNGYGIGPLGPFKLPISSGWPANVPINGAPGSVQEFTITCSDINGNTATSSFDIRIVSAGALPLHIHATPGTIDESLGMPLQTNLDWDSFTGPGTGYDYKSCAASAEDSGGNTIIISGWTNSMLSAAYIPSAPIYLSFKSNVIVPGPYGEWTKYIIHCSDNASNPQAGSQAEASVIVQTIPEGLGDIPQIDLTYSNFTGPVLPATTTLNWTSPNNTDFVSCTASAELGSASTGWGPSVIPPNSSNGNNLSAPGIVVTKDNEWYDIDCVDAAGQHDTDIVYIPANGGPNGGAKKHPKFIECSGSNCVGQ